MYGEVPHNKHLKTSIFCVGKIQDKMKVFSHKKGTYMIFVKISGHFTMISQTVQYISLLPCKQEIRS